MAAAPCALLPADNRPARAEALALILGYSWLHQAAAQTATINPDNSLALGAANAECDDSSIQPLGAILAELQRRADGR
eukprot:6326757-Lingulodinium_polyedra.AAC.1